MRRMGSGGRMEVQVHSGKEGKLETCFTVFIMHKKINELKPQKPKVMKEWKMAYNQLKVTLTNKHYIKQTVLNYST